MPGASTLVRMEGHGREEHLVPGADLSRTLGWFTSLYPVRLDLAGLDLADAFAGGPAAGRAVKAVKEQLRAVPDKGIGYGLLRHLNPETAAVLAAGRAPQIGFNYLGRTSLADLPQDLRGLGWAADTTHRDLVAAPDGDMPVLSALEINAVCAGAPDGDRLTASFGFPTGVLSRTEVTELAGLWVQALTALAQHAATPEAGGLTPSDAPLVDVSQQEIDTWEARFGKLAGIWPTTPAQSGMLFHTMLSGTAFDPYHMQMVFHLSGDVDPERMRRAGQALLGRYTNLRAAFVDRADGDVVQVVTADGMTLPWRHLDLTGDAERTETFERFLTEDRAAHFDTAAPPLIRLALAVLEPGRAELVMTCHHVLLDGWSMPLLMRDLLLLYASHGDPAPLPATRDYGDFLTWRAQQDAAESARVWTAELAGVEEATLLAPGADDAGEQGVGEVEVALPVDQAHELARRAAELGITVNTLVQGAWGLLLGRLTGRSDVVFGATVSGRPPAVTDVDSMVGNFINTLPVRVEYAPGDTLAEVLGRLQNRQAALLEHHHYGLSQIQQAVGLPSLFDTLVVFESYPIDREGLGAATEAADGIAFTGLRPSTATNYPLALMAAADPHLQLVFQYAPGVFDRDAVEVIAARLVRVLRQLAAEPELSLARLDILEPDERERLLAEFNDTAVPTPDVTVNGLVEAQAARTPDAVALVTDGESLTYREVNARADRLARELAGRGVGPESVVAVSLPRTANLVVALLAVLKAGGAYLPVDPKYPSHRLAAIFEEARPHLVLTDAQTLAALPEHGAPDVLLDTLDLSGDDAALQLPLHAQQLAYVMYTSGSTGKPKGVAITHANVVNGVLELASRVGLEPGKRLLAGTSINFDVSVFEIFTTLAAGGVVELVRDVLVLGERKDWSGGVISTVPSAFAELVDDISGRTEVETLVFAGEALPSSLIAKVRDAFPGVRVVNAYGQSESFYATTFTVGATPGPDGSAPVGTPLGNMRAYVLDSALAPVPAGHGRRTVRRRERRPRLPRPPRPDRRPLRRRPLRPGRLAHVPHRRPGPLERRGPTGVRGPRRRTGQGARLPHRARRGRGRAHRTPPGHPGRRRRPPGRGQRQAAPRVRGDVGRDRRGADPPVRRRAAARVHGAGRPGAPGPAAADAQRQAGPGRAARAGVHRRPLPGAAHPPRGDPGPAVRRGARPGPGRHRRQLLRAGGTLPARHPADQPGPHRVGDRDPHPQGLRSADGGRARSVARGIRRAPSPQSPPDVRLRSEAMIPLSFVQRRTWFLHQLEGAETWNISAAFRLTGHLDEAALVAALRDVVERHEILRTTYLTDDDGEPYQQILPMADAWEQVRVPVVEVTPESESAAVDEAVAHWFDLTAEIPLRARLLRSGPQEHVLVLVIHHIASDGSSGAPLARDLAAAYNARLGGRAPQWEPLPVQYKDFTMWQREVLGDLADPGSLGAQQIEYWRKELDGVPQPLNLPLDRPRSVETSTDGDAVAIPVAAEVMTGLQKLADGRGLTMSMVMQAALGVLLSKLGGGEDIPIGTPIAGRTDEALNDLIGCFVNNLVIRMDLSGDPTFADLLAQVRNKALTAYEHQDVPFEVLVEQLNPDRSAAYRPFFQVMCGWQNTEKWSLELAGLDVEYRQALLATTQVDVFFSMTTDESGALRGRHLVRDPAVRPGHHAGHGRPLRAGP